MAAALLYLSKTTFEYEEAITVTFERLANKAMTGDWIGLSWYGQAGLDSHIASGLNAGFAEMRRFACDREFEACDAAVAKGTVTFKAGANAAWPLRPGNYYAHYFSGNSYETVGPPPVAFTVKVRAVQLGAADAGGSGACAPSVVLLLAAALGAVAVLWT